MSRFIDRAGEVFGELTVLYCTQRASKAPKQKTKWMCECSCGDVREYQASNLVTGNSTCCIKCRQEGSVVHGQARRSEKIGNTYSSWHSMKYRCDNPKCKHFPDYGGRGIYYQHSWKDFTGFLEDMGDCPEGLTLERKDVNKGYTKENCKWATRSEQSYNRRKSKKNTSGVEGVYLRSDTGKWSAYINKEGKRHNLGCFTSKDLAINARRDAEIALYGEIKDN